MAALDDATAGDGRRGDCTDNDDVGVEDDDDDDGGDAPKIHSLDEWNVQLTDPVRRHLVEGYRGLYVDHDADDDDDENQDGDDISIATKKADAHVDRILAVMKIPPSTSILRVNQIVVGGGSDSSTTTTAIQQLLRQQSDGGENDDDVSLSECCRVQQHAVFSDVVCLDPVLSGAERFDDEVHARSLFRCRRPRSTNGIMSEATASEATSTTMPLFQHWPRRSKLGWPLTHKVIICDRYCGEAVLRGADIFVRGVMCADNNIGKGDVVAVYADIPPSVIRTKQSTTPTKPTPLPRGMVLEKYGRSCVFLGLGTAQCNRAAMFNTSAGRAVIMSRQQAERAGPVLPSLCSSELAPRLFVQNLPSIVVGHVLLADIRSSSNNNQHESHQQQDAPIMTILDMCAAPGGKTLHLASLVAQHKQRAIIVACDKSRSKMMAAKQLFTQAGADCICPLALDSTKIVAAPRTNTNGGDDDGGELTNDHQSSSVQQVILAAQAAAATDTESLLDVRHFGPESFDRILLDPPCSALGLRPKVRIEHTNVKDLVKHAAYQKKFVEQAVLLLKPGGVMTYSTCTIHHLENEGIVHHILERYGDALELLPIDPAMAPGSFPGLPCCCLTASQCQAVRRYDPSTTTSVSDTMGFFIAKFRKKA